MNRKVQNIMDETSGKKITVEALRDEVPAAEAELEEQDFLRWLMEQERECLQYLLETIESLEVDLGEENEEDGPTEINSSETAHDSPDGKEEYNSSTNVSRQSRLQISQETSGESEQIALQPNVSKMKLSKLFSEDSTGEPVTARQESLQKLVSFHPSYLRKFDTIMRSGVNVQELRARFLTENGASGFEEETKSTETSTSKQVLQLSGSHTSPREKALKKLGLLKRNQAILNTNSSPEASFSEKAQIPRAAVQTIDGVSNINEDPGPSTMSNSASSAMSSEETDHQEALKKLRLFHL